MKLVVYELNEVPYRILEEYCRKKPGSTVSKLMAVGKKFETIADDEGILSPWITWPTLHRGVTNRSHLISDFGQNLTEVNSEYPNYTDLLAMNGIKTGVFGSLHTYPLPTSLTNYAFYVPDTFAQGPECYPSVINAFQEFNLKMMDRSGRNVAGGIDKKEAIEFIKKIPQLGITVNTLKKIVLQFTSELAVPERKVRRRTSQTQIAFDVYLKLLKNTQPDCSTFFTNHVASSMHRYWPALFPDDYKSTRFSSEWLQKFEHEIEFTMDEANSHLTLLKNFVDRSKNYKLVIISSMGQAAVDGSEIMTNQLQVTNKNLFMDFLKVPGDKWESKRAMAPRYVYQISDSDVFNATINQLRNTFINGTPIDLTVHSNGIFVVKLGHANLKDDDIHIEVNGNKANPSEMGIENLEIQDATGSYAYHIPNGSFIIYDPKKPQISPQKTMATISTTEIAPAILKHFSINSPNYMENASSTIFN
jgi:hypothetical protein